MKKWILQFLLFYAMGICVVCAQQRGEYISFEWLETQTAASLGAEVQQNIGLPPSLLGIQYDFDVYRVIYYTEDIHPDSLTTASGLVVIPNNFPCSELGIFTFGHGLMIKDFEVPSNNDNIYAFISKGIAANGFIAAAPDYIHLGPFASPGFQAFMNERTESAATIDLIRAIKTFAAAQEIQLSEQLFLSGYSQGGHSSMATAKAIQENYAGELSVTALSSGGGTYFLSGTAADSLASLTRVTPEPHAFCLILRSYAEVYADSLQANGFDLDGARVLDSLFKPPYNDILKPMLDRVDPFFDQFQLDSVPIRMLNDAWKDMFINDPNHYFRKLLSYNDLYDWSPQMPVVMFHSTADIENPIENVFFTLQQFQLNGAPDVEIQTVDNFSHPDAALPYVLFTLNFMKGKRQSCYPLFANEIQPEDAIKIYPNPATHSLWIETNSNAVFGEITVYDSRTVPVLKHEINGELQMDISSLPTGNYLIALRKSGEKISRFRMFVKM